MPTQREEPRHHRVRRCRTPAQGGERMESKKNPRPEALRPANPLILFLATAARQWYAGKLCKCPHLLGICSWPRLWALTARTRKMRSLGLDSRLQISAWGLECNFSSNTKTEQSYIRHELCLNPPVKLLRLKALCELFLTELALNHQPRKCLDSR